MAENTTNQSKDWWLAPAQHLLNRGIAQSETATALCGRLAGRCVQIMAEGPGIRVNFNFTTEQAELSVGDAELVAASITGTPLNLLRLAGADPEAVIRAGDVRVTGDTEVAEDFRALLNVTRPDWEDELSKLTGDVVAHGLGTGLRRVRDWARRAEHTVARSLGEYLSEETRAVVTETELEEYCADVDQLTAAVDRAAARLNLLREQRATDQAKAG